MANISTRDVADARVLAGGAAVALDSDYNTIRYTQGNGNLDARIDSTSIGGTLSDDMDQFRIRLDLSGVNASFWVSGNEYKFGIFDGSTATAYQIWVIGTSGAPATLEIRDNAGVVTTVSYDPDVHRYIGHRYTSGDDTWHWEYSTDGITWSDLHSATRQTNFDTADVAIVMMRLENTANATSIGECIVSRVNTATPSQFAWDGFIKGDTTACRSVSPVLSELSASGDFQVRFKVDGEVFQRVIADQSKIDLLIPLSDLSSECVSVRLAWNSGTNVYLQLRTPDDSVQTAGAGFDASGVQAGDLYYIDAGQLSTTMWVRMVGAFSDTFLVDVVDAGATAFGGITNPRAVLWPVVGDDVGFSLADDDAAPLRMGALSIIDPSGTPWTDSAAAVRNTGAETGLVEHWPMNDGIHCTVLKGQEAAYDIAIGDGSGAVYGEHYWALPSSRPITYASNQQPADTTLVRNVAGTDTADATVGIFERNRLVLHRDGKETAETYRLNDDNYDIDLSYGGEVQIDLITENWPSAMESANTDGVPGSMRNSAGTEIIGMRVGYESGRASLVVEANCTTGGSGQGSQYSDVTGVIAGSPIRVRWRVEKATYRLDWMKIGAGDRTWTTVPTGFTITSVRTALTALKLRRSSKNNQGTAFGTGEETAWGIEQLGGPYPDVYVDADGFSEGGAGGETFAAQRGLAVESFTEGGVGGETWGIEREVPWPDLAGKGGEAFIAELIRLASISEGGLGGESFTGTVEQIIHHFEEGGLGGETFQALMTYLRSFDEGGLGGESFAGAILLAVKSFSEGGLGGEAFAATVAAALTVLAANHQAANVGSFNQQAELGTQLQSAVIGAYTQIANVTTRA